MSGQCVGKVVSLIPGPVCWPPFYLPPPNKMASSGQGWVQD